MVTLIWALAGLVFGSFANVCIYRIPKGMSIARPPSHCPVCGNKLTPVELVPVLSWLWQKGRCRQCASRIPVRYPVVELASCLLFLMALGRFGLTWEMLCWSAFFWLLLVMSCIDMAHMVIPDVLLAVAVICWTPLATQTFLHNRAWQDLLPSLYGALAGGGSLLVVLLACLLLFRREGLGWGDVKLMGVAGLYLGLENTVVALFAGIYTGAVVALVMLALKRWKRGMAIPFGPFLAVGVIVGAMCGQGIVHWYLGLMG